MKRFNKWVRRSFPLLVLLSLALAAATLATATIVAQSGDTGDNRRLG